MIETVGQLREKIKGIKDSTKIFMQYEDGLYYPIINFEKGFVVPTTNWAKDSCFDAIDPEDAHIPVGEKKAIEVVLLD